MYRFSLPATSNHQNAAAEYVRGCMIQRVGYDIVEDTTLTTTLLEVDERDRQIRIRSGETFQRWHQLAGRGWLYIKGGLDWAPEFRAHPRLHVVPAVPDLTRFKPVIPEPAACPSCLRLVAGGGLN